MKYLVLARRYRPQRFCDVIGQEAIITTLKNALSFDRVAHAYLFCGSRGVGKTTVARLFAKALNCQSPDAGNEPCNRCPSCLEILSGQSLDVIEIDGASNRGIDDIRQLNETIGYAPSHGKYKIYIIDEVHMLTKEAFNALLKTLEEPPERAKFFFATTEPHKVLPTIVSRCQRFDMQRLSEAQIVQKLISIAGDLKREVSPEALHLIASFAEGSVRDAESLFDQILCFTDGAIQAEQARNVLGLVPDELFFELDNAFNEGRVSFAFELVERLFHMGKDLSHFLEQLIGHYRRLTLAKTMGTPSLGLPEPLFSCIDRAVKLYTQAQLFYILETLLNSFATLQKSPMQRASLESILLHVLRSKNRIPVEVLIRRLNELEQKLSENEPASLGPETIPSSETQVKKLTPAKIHQTIAPPQELGANTGESPEDRINEERANEEKRPEGGQLNKPATEQSGPGQTKLAIKPVPFNPFTHRADAQPVASAPKICRAQDGLVNLDAARQCKIEGGNARDPNESDHSQIGKANEEDQFCKAVASPNSQNQTERGIEPQENKQTPQSNTLPVSSKALSSGEPSADPRRYETLLRFAAVELEGTIKT